MSHAPVNAPPQLFRSTDDHLEEWPRQLLPSALLDRVGLGVRQPGLVVEGDDVRVADNGGSVKPLDVLLQVTGGVHWWDVGGVGGVINATTSSLLIIFSLFFVRSSGGGVVVHRCRRGIGTERLL